MARYAASGVSAAALANNTGLAWLQGSATSGCSVRRITLGANLTTGAAIASTQLQVQIFRTTSAGTTPGGTLVPALMDVWGNATSQVTNPIATTYVTPPTKGAVPLYTLDFNSQSGIDFPFEIDELVISRATTDGIVLHHNSGAALPASTVISFSIIWYE